MGELKVERELLEQKYKQALGQHLARCAEAANDPCEDALESGSGAALTPLSEVVDQIMALSHVRDSLRQENSELKKAVARYFTFQRRLQQSIEDMDNESDHDAELLAATPSCGYDADSMAVLTRQMSRVTLSRSMTSTECAELNSNAYNEMLAFLSRVGGHSTAGTNVHGWQEYRNTVNGRFRFSSQKLFHMQSALELSSKSWTLLSSPHTFTGLYSSNIPMQVDLAQQVDDDNVVFYRTLQLPSSTKVAKSLFLLSRFHTELGYMLFLQSIDHAQYLPVVPSSVSAPGGTGASLIDDDSVWMEMFTWIVFSEVGAAKEHCQMDLGGFAPNATPEMADFWMLEVLLISLRWETQVIGPVFKVNS
uniref:START domain-containing protein n=1 Tax=Globisporangium ultimum (strain ATCC 200006 / CBS 805.95 / DAOM BR144) TaxID=431595 RepID=K3WNQ1_GLOUD